MYLFTLSAFIRAEESASINAQIEQGGFKYAASMVMECLEKNKHTAALKVDHAILCADLLLAQGREEDATEYYRLALKLAAACERGISRLVATRNTGFISLSQCRFGTAASCFRRILNSENVALKNKVEAYCGLASACYGMGRKDEALAYLDYANELAVDSRSSTLMMVAHIMRIDILVQNAIRSHSELQDHIFWRLISSKARSVGQEGDLLSVVDAAIEQYKSKLVICKRLFHLKDLLAVVNHKKPLQSSVLDYLKWLRSANMAIDEKQARIEIALTAIVSRNVDIAKNVIEPLGKRETIGVTQRWSFELQYCLSKICAMSGRIDESLKYYQTYALDSVQCVRAEVIEPLSDTNMLKASETHSSKDDVEMSLPVKYRKAYRYILDHLTNATLSIREVADVIGVTERALQLAFKISLGMTPAEVVRRCRIERIRQDLLRGDSFEKSVVGIASHWGISNRSTLVSVYRKYFHETPAETLSRSSDFSELESNRDEEKSFLSQ
jgi:AraC-like DNA-binding protein/tetratricopeptide (TPR) repeat protein